MHEQSHRKRLLTQPEAAGLVTVPANVCAGEAVLTRAGGAVGVLCQRSH